MQIKLATARGVGYTGDAQGLHDPDTNLTYGVKYLAGAWRAANGNHDRAVRYFASGYYYVAKRQRLDRGGPVLASAPPKEAESARDGAAEVKDAGPPIDAVAEPKLAGKPLVIVSPPKTFAARQIPLPRKRPKMLAEAKVPRPATGISGANAAKPR
jgi:hypothetical protein